MRQLGFEDTRVGRCALPLRTVVVCALALFTCTGTAWAQEPLDLNSLLGGKKPRAKAAKATFSADWTMNEAARDELTLTVTAKLPPEHYIYGVGTDSFTRTEITVDGAGVEPIDATFTPSEPAKVVFDPVFKANLEKHYDGATWMRRYRRTDNRALTTKVTLEGQYCSEGEGGTCTPILPPFEVMLSLPANDTPPVTPASSAVASYEATHTDKLDGLAKSKWTVRLEPTNAKPGDTVTLFLDLLLPKGFHTYSVTMSKELSAIPTQIETTGLEGLTFADDGWQAEPAATPKEVADIQETHEVHKGRVTFRRTLTVAEDRAVGDYGVAGRVRYQACDVRQCHNKEFEFAVGQVAAATPQLAETDVPDEGPANTAGPIEIPLIEQSAQASSAAFKAQGFGPFLTSAIVAGFLALLTPCVFPMIPITVSFFLTHTGHGPGKASSPIPLAAVYCGSIILTFTALGVLISAFFGATALNALANNPWLNIAIGGVFVAFALSLLGMFEIQMPSWLLTVTAGRGAQGGYLGAVFMAITFTLTSFTCTFAFAGNLLILASQGDYWWPILGMVAFSTAFASPFFLLACFPSLLAKLPRSGGWMNVVKVVMGLVELGFAIKFFAVADYAWNPSPVLFDFHTVMICWCVLSLATAAYLMGLFRLNHDMPVEHLSAIRLMLAMGFAWFGLFVGLGALQPEAVRGVVMPQVLAFAPPRLVGEQSDLGPVIENHGLVFALDVNEAIPAAKKANRPLFLDFTGVNCVNCRLMEVRMQQPANVQRLKKFMAVQLYADKVPTITDADYAQKLLTQNRTLQTQWFGDVTLPSYAVVTPDGKTILSMYSGLERADGEFAKFLDEGWSAWEQRRQATALRP